jgi:serine/threonine protein kinase
MAKPNLQLNSYFGSYFLVKLIAVGGMAEIYLARTKGLAGFEKQLALKVIHPDYADDRDFVQMLVNEAKIAVGLNHPNIAQTFDLGKINNRYFISMEYVDGADFFQILKRLGDAGATLPIEAALKVAHDTLCGLEYAHTKVDDQGNPLKIIHRDISPQNILVSRHGEVKIVDFGIAKAANLTNKTRAGVIKGKLIYMSPEQAWGDPVDGRTDIFSTGIVLYEALTAGSLYLEKNPVRLLEMVRKAEIKPPSSRRTEISAELDTLVMKALAPRPADRYPSAREFAEIIAEYLRRTNPSYGEQELGELIEAVLSGSKRRAGPSAEEEERMKRDDFAAQEHSMIFSADDMLDSSVRRRAPDITGPQRPIGVQTPGTSLRAKLLLLENGEAKPFVIGEQFVIGRAGDLRLGDARVSRRHARIVLYEGVYMVEDLGSANGTFLNEEKVEGPTQLRSGDTVRVGPYEMRFVIEEGLPVPAGPVLAPSLAPVQQGFEADVTPIPPPLPETGPSPPPPVAPAPPAKHVSPADLTVGRPEERRQPANGAALRFTLGSEELTLPIGDQLPLSHVVGIGSTELVGEAASLVRRADGYWLEPGGGEAILHNGQPVTSPRPLAPGDRLQVGPLALEFVG